MHTEQRAEVVEPIAYPADGRRVVFYLLHDSRGDVDDYIVYKLSELRPFAEHIFVVVNGELTEEGRRRLEPVADTVWVRENVGFDVWGYKSALAHFGMQRLAEYDELILMNYTWFGPVRSFAPLFERMDQEQVDFWGLTDYGEETPNPYTRTGVLHRHMQSHWIAVRRSMFTSPQWRDYWATMPMITTYTQSILQHESRFTHHFEQLGFVSAVAFSVDDYPSQHPALLNAELLMDDGCPALKRRAFFHYPPYLDQHAVIGRWTIERAESYGYPVGMLYQNLVKNAPPKSLYADASMMEVLPDVDVSYDPANPLRLAAVVHIFYDDMTDELMDRLVMLPESFDLFITTTDQVKADAIQAVLDRRADAKVAHSEIRILPSNRGRDLSAFFIACRDVLEPGRYDLIVKIHSKKTVQDSYNAGRYFKYQQLDNVLHRPGYAANAVALFQKEAGPGPRVPADDPHRIPDDGSRLVREQGAGRGARQGTRHPGAVRRHLAARSVRLHLVRTPRGAAASRRSGLEVRGVRRAGPPQRRESRPRPGADHHVRRGRAGLPHAHHLDSRAHGDQPHRARLQAGPDGRHDARIPDRPDPVPASCRMARSRRDRRAHAGST